MIHPVSSLVSSGTRQAQGTHTYMQANAHTHKNKYLNKVNMNALSEHPPGAMLLPGMCQRVQCPHAKGEKMDATVVLVVTTGNKRPEFRVLNTRFYWVSSRTA